MEQGNPTIDEVMSVFSCNSSADMIEYPEEYLTECPTLDKAISVFSCNASKMCCIFFISLGTVKQLRKKMNICADHNDNDIVCKYGFAKDFLKKLYGFKKKIEKNL